MFFSSRDRATADARGQHELKAQVAAIDRSMAVIEFKLDGTILRANANFLMSLGYSASEVEGRQHSMFVRPDEAASDDYREFWQALRRGEFIARKFLRIGKGGKECWIQASYNPILDEQGRPYKVVKFATDITAGEVERARAEAERQRAAEEQAAVVSALAEGLKAVAGGDLTARITAALQGRYRRIKDDFNDAVESLHAAVGAIASATSGLCSGCDEIASASDDLSRRSEQQAAGLEQTAASLDEITGAVKMTAAGAKQARELVGEARRDAQLSNDVVAKAVSAMGSIEQSSSQIGQIIGVIDEIAFQTNLLALNAGVEAARAGDAGRGFAVVASEVRALAQRSAEAAKEIKALILSSDDHVKAGVDLVSQTGKALSRIIQQVVEIDSVVANIAMSAQEQATGLTQVNVAINQMDQVTQQNAAMVEQSTAAADRLRTDAGDLARSVARFRIDSHANGVAQSRARIAALVRQGGL